MIKALKSNQCLNIIFLGAILGIILEDKLNDAKGYIFAALSGIFLYSSLSALFPVLKKDMSDSYDSRRRRLFRLILALGGFLLAMVIIIPLVYFKNDMKAKTITTARDTNQLDFQYCSESI